jgi:hypothetical protein
MNSWLTLSNHGLSKHNMHLANFLMMCTVLVPLPLSTWHDMIVLPTKIFILKNVLILSSFQWLALLLHEFSFQFLPLQAAWYIQFDRQNECNRMSRKKQLFSTSFFYHSVTFCCQFQQNLSNNILNDPNWLIEVTEIINFFLIFYQNWNIRLCCFVCYSHIINHIRDWSNTTVLLVLHKNSHKSIWRHKLGTIWGPCTVDGFELPNWTFSY